MKKVLVTSLVAVAACCTTIVFANALDETFLAEMKKCAVCKAMAEKPDLVEKMSWETHKIDNGMLCVATVPKEHVKEFSALHEQMMQSVAKAKADLQQGKSVELCSFCDSMGELEKAGARQQEIRTSTGAISLFTSTDPNVVKKLHAQADKANAEQKQRQQQKAIN